MCLYADEAESSSHKENFSMLFTYLSPVELKVKTTFFGIVNLNEKTAAQVMDAVNLFFSPFNIYTVAILNMLSFYWITMLCYWACGKCFTTLQQRSYTGISSKHL